MCLLFEVIVLILNIICFICGLVACVWFAWMEKREKLAGGLKQICLRLSRWRCCKWCFRRDFRIWLQSVDVKWTNNPLEDDAIGRERAISLKAIKKKGIDIESDEEKSTINEVCRLKEEIERLKEENGEIKTKMEKEIRTLTLSSALSKINVHQ